MISASTFPDELDVKRFIILNVGLFGLQLFMGGICFLCSCIFNDSKRAGGVAAAFVIAFNLIQMISNVGEKYDNLKYLTPITLFSPVKIIAGEASAIPMFCILYVFGIVFYVAGAIIFCKRDLPL